MKKWLISLVVVSLSGCSLWNQSESASPLPEGIRLIESKPANPDVASIPYSKYKLDNGLTLILSPDHSDPLVHVDVTYHVGSAREKIGRSGFAHFFEHMMFQGSEHVGDQQHFKIVTEAGGTLNGTTNRDRTNYFETVPSNQLEKMLWLESDRMGFLVNAISQRKFEIQRDTVKNERGQNYDNRPYGLMYEKMGEALYPQTHPYSWQTIGYVEDLDRVDVNDLKDFFLRWYGPNNAVLTIGGDINEAQTLKWVVKYFGSIPKGPEVENAPKQPVILSSDRFVTLPDRIRQPMVMMAFPTEYRGAKSEASLDALASILGDGKNSLLYQYLVKTEKAVDAGAFQDCAELTCTLYVYAMGDAGDKGDLKPIYQALNQTLALVKTQGVQQDQLDAITGQAEAATIYALQSVSGKVSQLAANQTFFNQPDRLQTELAQIRNVTPKSVKDAYLQFVDGKHKVVLSVVPKGQEQLAVQATNFVPAERYLPHYPKITDQELNIREAKDDFDRSVMPPVGEPVTGVMPDLYRFNLPNGIEVLGTQTQETPTVAIQIAFPAGQRYVEAGQEGLAGLTAQMLQEGTTLHTSEQLQQQLDKLGSSVSVSAGGYHASLVITSLTKNLEATLKVADEMLFKPAFQQSDFMRIKNQTIQGIIYSHQQPSWLASQATKQVLYRGTLFSRDSDGSVASLQALTLEDVKRFYHSHYTPQGAKVVVVGALDKAQAEHTLGFLQKWQGQAVEMPQAGAITPLTQQHLYVVDKPNSPQSVVRLARIGMPYDATGEMYLTQLANYNLGGNFNSRINLNLREDKGFTYGAGGSVFGTKETGMILYSAQVRADATAASIHELLSELKRYSQEGMTEDELAFMKQAVGQQDALKYETPGQKAGLLYSILDYSLSDDFITQKAEIVKKVDKQTLNNAARTWFQPQDFQIIVVGDAQKLMPELEKLGIPLQKLEVQR
ncbi:M16 family metallopeptidase [Vibrio aphrogenes]|uniref:M16 family metallopeptidase n=1 Tax=Vibrio aphrogenes TaxID=1891186 RepID=UPI000B34C5A2|nr:pitrilysin family protein [Vibrio aphrogenes]